MDILGERFNLTAWLRDKFLPLFPEGEIDLHSLALELRELRFSHLPPAKGLVAARNRITAKFRGFRLNPDLDDRWTIRDGKVLVRGNGPTGLTMFAWLPLTDVVKAEQRKGE